MVGVSTYPRGGQVTAAGEGRTGPNSLVPAVSATGVSARVPNTWTDIGKSESMGSAHGGAYGTTGSMEGTLRPFIMVGVQPQEVVTPRKPLPGEGSEAFISWGQPADFLFTPPPEQPFVDPTGGLTGGQRTNFPPDRDPDDQPDEDEEEQVTVYTEIKEKRVYSDPVKIYDPSDSTVWVEVKRIKSQTFRSNKDSIVRKFEYADWE